MSPEYRGRVRPGKTQSLIGMIAGIGFLIFGLAMFGSAGGPMGMWPPPAFLLLWIVVTGGMAAFNAYNYFSEKGAPVMEVNFELPGPPGTVPGPDGTVPGEFPASGFRGHGAAARPGGTGDFDVRLRKLQSLRDDGLISEEEFQAKRAEIMAEKW